MGKGWHFPTIECGMFSHVEMGQLQRLMAVTACASQRLSSRDVEPTTLDYVKVAISTSTTFLGRCCGGDFVSQVTTCPSNDNPDLLTRPSVCCMSFHQHCSSFFEIEL
jgi:hypothetical protein